MDGLYENSVVNSAVINYIEQFSLVPSAGAWTNVYLKNGFSTLHYSSANREVDITDVATIGECYNGGVRNNESREIEQNCSATSGDGSL